MILVNTCSRYVPVKTSLRKSEKKKLLETQPQNLFFLYVTCITTDKHARALCT